MIPKNIKRDNILDAIEEIEKNGIPAGRTSKKFSLEYNKKLYPPKYLISVANKYINGTKLNPSEFSGGKESNNFLKRLGFNIVISSSPNISLKASTKSERKKLFLGHYRGERCPDCKETVKNLLEKTYGEVIINHKFSIGNHPEDYIDRPYYNSLKEIYVALQRNRGFGNFVRAKTLPNCDFFIPNPGFIVEFDESQHFTIPRKIALEHYPKDLNLGFDTNRWIELCEKLHKKDNKPPYRDEQRSWYDTLRDFLPLINNLKPTVRIFARDYKWCSLDYCNNSDINKFKKLLNIDSERRIEIREDKNSFLARVIITSDWLGNVEEAKRVLENICEQWPKDMKVKIIMTCGGFIQFDWPDSVSKSSIGDNKNPNIDAVNILIQEAQKYAEYVLNSDLVSKLKSYTNYITLGIDSFKKKISTTKNYIRQPHIELVCIYSINENKFYWTGKSYPTNRQQKGLIRITNLETHFINLNNIGNTLVLGCHDLSVFNPRSKNAKGWRKKINEEFRELTRKEKPVVVLHHPHTAVKKRTWLNAWNCLKRTLPSVRQYYSAGRYFEPDSYSLEWDPLDKVLQITKNGNSLDFIIRDS